jgi:guanylate kinase
VGKGPLFAALKRFYPDLAGRFRQLVLFNDRDPRPGEEDGVDYHFRPRQEIEALRGKEGYVVAEVRGDLQALEVDQIQQNIDEGFDPFFEGNPFVPAALRKAGVLDRFSALTVFLSPLSREEVVYLTAPEQRVDLSSFVTDVQRRKLLHRTRRQKGDLSYKDLENIERRAASAIVELREACRFQHVIPVHDGEANDNWDAFYYPIGDARRALLALARLLAGETSHDVESWDEGLIPT